LIYDSRNGCGKGKSNGCAIGERGGFEGDAGRRDGGPRPRCKGSGAFTALGPLIRQFDVDPIPIFKRAGVSATAFNDADARIPYIALGRILHEAAARTRCAHFGLLAGRVWHLSDLGVVGQLVRNTPTVGEALHKLNVHQHLNCEGAVPFLRETAGVADFGFAIYDAGVTGLEQLFDSYIATRDELRSRTLRAHLDADRSLHPFSQAA
jgi:hypothetical protein